MFDKLKGFQQQNAPLIDEHDEPTEPIRKQDVDAFVPTIPNDEAENEVVPVPRPETHPFPHRFSEPVPATPVYPVLPPRPNIEFRQPPGGQNASKPAEASAVQKKASRRIVPLTVGMCFVAIQVLLLARFFLRLVDVSSDTLWVGAVYGVSNVLVLPFRILFLELAIPQFYTVELYTLVAIIAYGIVSRLVVRILKVLFNAR